MNIKDTGRHGVALGLASILVAGGSLALPSAAEASQLRTDGGAITIYANTWLDIDEQVALRKEAMSLARATGR